MHHVRLVFYLTKPITPSTFVFLADGLDVVKQSFQCISTRKRRGSTSIGQAVRDESRSLHTSMRLHHTAGA